MTIAFVMAVAALALTVVAALTDLRSARIPGWLTWPAIVIGPCAWGLVGGRWPFAYAVLSSVACGLVPLALYASGAMGGGDVKLAIALGGLVGARLGLESLLVGFTLVALVAVGGLVWSGELSATLLRTIGGLLRARRAPERPPGSALPEPLRRRVRFAPSVLVGALVALLPELLLRG